MMVLIGIAAAIVGALYNGWALSVLWNWFVVPLGFPAIGIAHAIGLVAVLLAMARHVPRDDEHINAMLIHELTTPGLAVLIGWIALQFMR